MIILNDVLVNINVIEFEINYRIFDLLLMIMAIEKTTLSKYSTNHIEFILEFC